MDDELEEDEDIMTAKSPPPLPPLPPLPNTELKIMNENNNIQSYPDILLQGKYYHSFSNIDKVYLYNYQIANSSTGKRTFEPLEEGV